MSMMGSVAGLAIVFIVALAILSVVFIFARGYKKVANDELLVVYGRGGNKKSEEEIKNSKTCSGGGIFVVPFFQDFKKISLKPMSVDIDLKSSLTKNSIRINVPSQFTVAIDTTDAPTLQNAITRILTMTEDEIRKQVEDIVLGQFRDVINTMDINEINQDRDGFVLKINKSVETELKKIGLIILNFNIKDITDEGGYIEALGKREMTSAMEKAAVDVSEQQRIGATGVSDNERQRDIKVAENNSAKDIGIATANRQTSVETARLKTEQISKENEYSATLAQSNAELAIKEAESRKEGETARARSDQAIYNEQKLAEQSRIEKETVPQANVEKLKLEINAEAEAETQRIRARGDADSIVETATAQAKATKMQLEAQAEGFAKIVESFGGDNQAAMSAMMMEHLPEIARINAEAVKSMDFGKITLINGGGNGGQGGESAVGDFMKGLFQSVPVVGEVLNSQGYDLPNFMGKKNDNFVDTNEDASDKSAKQQSPVARKSKMAVDKPKQVKKNEE